MKKYYFLIIIICLLLNTYKSEAQKITPHDTGFYTSYQHLFMGRVYFTQKYDHVTFPAFDKSNNLKYASNGKLGFGIGATYNNLTLNVAYGFSFLNNNKDRGKTKGLDFQFHLFPSKWAIDANLTGYKGAYILPQGFGTESSNGYYYRNDVKMDLFGLSAYRVANSNRFSYRAAMVQNEWQKRSAGSLLYGGGIYYGAVKGDSMLIPSKVANLFPDPLINNLHYITVGPGIGYAYTAVAAQHFFIMGSVIANVDVNFVKEQDATGSNSKIGIAPFAIYKGAIGYNGSVWSVAAIVGGNALLFKGSANKDYFQSTGQYKLFIAKKIFLKKH